MLATPCWHFCLRLRLGGSAAGVAAEPGVLRKASSEAEAGTKQMAEAAGSEQMAEAVGGPWFDSSLCRQGINTG